MSCLIPPACVFCRHYHYERNDQSTEIPSCDAFDAIPEEIFMGRFDHSEAFPGDKGVQFRLIEAERDNFLELNAVREELGLMTYRVAPVCLSMPEFRAAKGPAECRNEAVMN
jgi:hypothetical protein